MDKNEVNKLFFELLDKIPEATKRLINLSVDISNKVVDAMREKELDIKQLAEMTGKKNVSSWLTGGYNYTLSDIIILEIALDIKLIEVDNG